jgi:uncharacterized protein
LAMRGHPQRESGAAAVLLRRSVSVLWILIWVATWSFFSGCATYNEKLADVRAEADRGAYSQALDQLNDILDVDSVEEVPESFDGNISLATLERAVLLQAQSEFALSARDLSNAETDLEMIDLGTDAAGKIGKYVYSDSSDDYTASPTERLAMSGLNMANYLALGDLDGAAVEARRYTNMRDYLASIGLQEMGTFGSYLAGFTFEHLGEGDRALRYYEEALEGKRIDSLKEPVARLARTNPYRGPRINALLDDGEEQSHSTGGRPAELLIVFAFGRVPHKVPERIPIGAAVGIAGTWITGNTAILERSAFKVVVYPELKNSQSQITEAKSKVGGKPANIEFVSDLGRDIEREYEEIKPRIIGAAISRMIARAVAAEGARMAGKQAGSAGGIIGLLAALITEGSLVALDRPDTRSWSFLPNRIAIARTPVRAGTHRVDVEIGGAAESRSATLDIPDGGFGVVVVTVPR